MNCTGGESFEWILGRAEREDPNPGFTIEVLGHLVSIEGGIVADKATIDLELFQPISIYLFLWVEKGWGSRRSTSGIANRNIVDLGLLLRIELGVEAWLLAVIVISSDEDLVRDEFRHFIGSELLFHDILKTLSVVLCGRQFGDNCVNDIACNEANNKVNAHADPVVFNFLNLQSLLNLLLSFFCLLPNFLL